MSSLQGRVRRPSDRNLSAAALRTAMVPTPLLLHQYRHVIADFVEIVGYENERPIYRSYFRNGDRFVCVIRSTNWAKGVRLPQVHEHVVLIDPTNLGLALGSFVVTAVQAHPKNRTAFVDLVPA